MKTVKPFHIYIHRYASGYKKNFKMGRFSMECPDVAGRCYGGFIVFTGFGYFIVFTLPGWKWTLRKHS